MGTTSPHTEDFEVITNPMERLSPVANTLDNSNERREVPSPPSKPSGQESQEDGKCTASPLIGVEAANEVITPSPALIEVHSLLSLFEEIPGFELQDSTYRFCGPISGSSSTNLFEKTQKVGRLTLSDTDKALSPSIFLRLGLLRNPAGYLFPSLTDLLVTDGNSYLDFLSLFASPTLRHLELSGVDEANEHPLVAFLKSAPDEAPEISSLLFSRNQVSQKTIEVVGNFKHLRALHLNDTISNFNFHLLIAIGRIQSLEDLTFCQSEGTTRYRSRAAILADERDGQLTEEEKRWLQAEEVERIRLENARLLEAEDEKRREGRERTERRKRRKIEREEKRKIEEEERVKKEERERVKREVIEKEIEERIELEVIEKEKAQRRLENSEAKNVLQAFRRRGAELSNRLDAHDLDRVPGLVAVAPGLQSAPRGETLTLPPTLSTLAIPLQTAITTKKKRKEGKLNKNGASAQLLPVAPPLDSMRPSKKLFVNVKTLNITGPSSLITDLVELSRLVGLECINITFTRDSDSHEAPSKFIDLITRSCWNGSLSDVTINAEKLSGTSRAELCREIFQNLLLGRHIRRLDLKGWRMMSLGISFLRPLPFFTSKLEYLSLPFHPEAEGITLSQLGIITHSFPRLAYLACRLSNLENVPTPSSQWPSDDAKNHHLLHLAIGSAESHAKTEQVLDIARYINHLFPNLLNIQTHQGAKQNTEQWELIGKVVRMLQDVRSDERKTCLAKGV